MRTIRILLMSMSLYVTTITPTHAQNNADYIQKWNTLAQKEMLRSGIPASIILGQAILESNAGKSELAQKSNNHFGLKAGANWKGKTVQAQDDENAPSNFRAYDNIEASFVDHTEHLLNMPRYANLFAFASTDYKNWSKGLKVSGYATRADYAEALIRVIEENQLQRFDLPTSFSTGKKASTDFMLDVGAQGAATTTAKGAKPAGKGEVLVEMK
jgi:flagellum-specific peptidoglycan hydrolase FlgJ